MISSFERAFRDGRLCGSVEYGARIEEDFFGTEQIPPSAESFCKISCSDRGGCSSTTSRQEIKSVSSSFFWHEQLSWPHEVALRICLKIEFIVKLLFVYIFFSKTWLVSTKCHQISSHSVDYKFWNPVGLAHIFIKMLLSILEFWKFHLTYYQYGGPFHENSACVWCSLPSRGRCKSTRRIENNSRNPQDMMMVRLKKNIQIYFLSKRNWTRIFENSLETSNGERLEIQELFSTNFTQTGVEEKPLKLRTDICPSLKWKEFLTRSFVGLFLKTLAPFFENCY